jgi:formate hydrogenlyase subunit 6/NADH:ubiquinone oxidoreductase subunit I
MLEKIKTRRSSVRERRKFKLADGLPATITELIVWLENCAPCRECLEACPIYAGELERGGNSAGALETAVRHWLAGCVACGMCEEACSRGFPMAAIIHRMEDELALA